MLYPFLLLLAILVLLPMFSVTWPKTHDLFRYPLLSYAFKNSFVNGFLYPRWLPDLGGGYGYPSFVFYQPGLFYLVLICQVLAGKLSTAYQFAFVLLFFSSFLGIYKLAGEFTKDLATRIFAVFVFLLTPYLYVNLYVRGDLSELASLLLTPWPLYFLMQAEKNKENFKAVSYTFSAASALAAMVYFHPFPCVIFFPFFLVFSVVMVWQNDGKKDFRILKMAVIALIASAIMSSPFWLNAFLMKPSVHAERAMSGYFLPEYHSVYLSQLFSNFWGFGISTQGIKDTMPFQLGLMHFLLATAGVILAYKDKKILITFICYIILIVLMTPAADILWKYCPVLSILQFPWRLLSVIAVLQVVCCLGLGKIKHRNKNMVYVLIILISLIWYHQEFSVKSIPQKELNNFPQFTEFASRNFITATSSNEFMPITAKTIIPRGNAPLIQSSHINCQIIPSAESNKNHLRYTVDVKQPVVLRINQYYFPGWRVYLNGERVADEDLIKNLSADGLMQLQLPSGSNQSLEAYYDGPPGWQLINVFAFIPVLAFFVLFIKHKRVKKELKA